MKCVCNIFATGRNTNLKNHIKNFSTNEKYLNWFCLYIFVNISTLFILRIYRHYINQVVSKYYICILLRSCFWQTSHNACMNTAFLCKKRVVIICFLTSFLVVKALVYNWNNCTTKKENSCSCHLVELLYVEQD